MTFSELSDLNVTNITLAVIALVTIYTLLKNLPQYVETWTKVKQTKINANEMKQFNEYIRLMRKTNIKISRMLALKTKALERITEEMKYMRDHNNIVYEKLNDFEKELIKKSN